MQEELILEDYNPSIIKNHHRIKTINIFIFLLIFTIAMKALSTLLIHNGYVDLLYNEGRSTSENGYSILIIVSTIVNALYYLITLVLAILFILWFSRAYHNLVRFGLTTKFSPSFSAWIWFVPFANIIFPLLIMKELVVKIEILLQKVTERKILGNYDVKIVNYWWWLFIAGMSLPLVQYFILSSSISEYYIVHSSLLNVFILSLIGDVILIIAAVLLYFVLKNILPMEEKIFFQSSTVIENMKENNSMEY